MEKKMEQTTTIENVFWKYLRWDLTNGITTLKKIKNSWALSTPKDKRALKLVMKKLPEGVDHFIDPQGRYVFGFTNTPETKYEFLEIKASLHGELLAEKKQEVLEFIKDWKEILKDLRDAKLEKETMEN